jgi:hypothetical protein
MFQNFLIIFSQRRFESGIMVTIDSFEALCLNDLTRMIGQVSMKASSHPKSRRKILVGPSGKTG